MFNHPALPTIGRFLMAIIFIVSGIGKVTAPEAAIGYITAMSVPAPVLALTGAIAVELIGGGMLLLGVCTRYVALVLAVFSIVTGAIFHGAIGDQNQLIHLLKNLAMAGGLLQVAAFGAGASSFDARRARTKGIRTT